MNIKGKDNVIHSEKLEKKKRPIGKPTYLFGYLTAWVLMIAIFAAIVIVTVKGLWLLIKL